MDKSCLIVKTKARLAANGSSHVQYVKYFESFAPTHLSAQVEKLFVNEHGVTIFKLDVEQAFVRAKLEAELYMKLPLGYGDKPVKLVGPSVYG